MLNNNRFNIIQNYDELHLHDIYIIFNNSKR